MAKILKKLVFLLILILSLSTFAFATVTGENENGHTLTVDLSLSVEDIESFINYYSDKLSTVGNSDENFKTLYQTIDKYYVKRAYDTNLQKWENEILSEFKKAITEDTRIDKKNIIVALQAQYEGASTGKYYPHFLFFINNNSVSNVLSFMKVRYSSSNKIILDGTTANRCYYNVYTRFKNEYTENVFKFTSNVFDLFLDTSKIDISVTSDSVIDIPILYGVTNTMPIVYYKTLNETNYFPYILKNYNKTTSGGGETGGEGGGETGGETGGGSSDTDKIIGEIKGEVVEIKDDVATIKDKILTKEKLQEILEKEPTTSKDDFEDSFPSVEVNDPTSDFFTWIFEQIENVFTNTTPQVFEFSLFSGTTYKINSNDVKTPNSPLKTFVALSISFSIFYYILQDVRKIVNKVKEGQIESLAQEDITANMV